METINAQWLDDVLREVRYRQNPMSLAMCALSDVARTAIITTLLPALRKQIEEHGSR